MPETYAPVILKRRAQKLRKDTGNSTIASPLEIQSRNIKEMMIITISRPFRMLFHESIVSLSSLYLALAYAIFYLYFEAYPIIFQGSFRDPNRDSVGLGDPMLTCTYRHLQNEPRYIWSYVLAKYVFTINPAFPNAAF